MIKLFIFKINKLNHKTNQTSSKNKRLIQIILINLKKSKFFKVKKSNIKPHQQYPVCPKYTFIITKQRQHNQTASKKPYYPSKPIQRNLFLRRRISCCLYLLD